MDAVRSGGRSSRRMKSFAVSYDSLAILNLAINDKLPGKLDEILKACEVIPKDAYMDAWFYPPQQSCVILRYLHSTFPEISAFDVIETEGIDIDKLWKINRPWIHPWEAPRGFWIGVGIALAASAAAQVVIKWVLLNV